jgi:hypothetical protein
MQLLSTFTPPTLTVIPSTAIQYNVVQFPSLNMSAAPNSFAGWVPNHIYSVGTDISTESLTFVGPRSILTRLASWTASSGIIPALTPPANISSFSQSFSGPYVKCEEANSTVQDILQKSLDQKMSILQGTYRETINAYWGFVPSFDTNSNGTYQINYNGRLITALSQPRKQQPQNATNELWYTFMRYRRSSNGTIITDSSGAKVAERQFSQCKLYHAIYDIKLDFDSGSQIITKTNITTLDVVDFPNNSPYVRTNLTQQTYSAYFSVLTDLVVGSMGFLNDTEPDGSRSPAYSQIDTPLIRSSLLGSNDLDFFFDTNKILYLNNSDPFLSPQRLLDKALAKNQTLPSLFEDLSFNITMSFLINPLLRFVVMSQNGCNEY